MAAGKDGGPAFPLGSTPEEWMNGMTLRDYFAAAALQGFIACHTGSETSTPDAVHSAGRAYEYADAMLAERAK